MEILALSNHGNTFNPKEGADVRKFHLITELAKHNRTIVLESDRYIGDRERIPPSVEAVYYKEYYLFGKPLSFLIDFNPDLIRKIYTLVRGNSLDAVLISFPYGFLAMRLILLLAGKKIPLIYDAHNVEGDLIGQTEGDPNPRLVNAFLRCYVPFLEYLIVRYLATSIIVVSTDDRSLFQECYRPGHDRFKVIPSGTRIRERVAAGRRDELRPLFGIESDEIAVVFHGTYKYPPNHEAIQLIRDVIAPRIYEKDRTIRFILAGNGVPPINQENILSLGYIQDIFLLLSAADIAIVPIRAGGGTRLKILDYMGAGLPIITTRKGIEGIAVENGREAIIVEEVDEAFVAALETLARSRDERRRIGENARMTGERRYDWTMIGRDLHDHLGMIIREYSCVR
jgi:polysaccharide biosynthesis protein PslH